MIGILGGSFDPVHNGHLMMAQAAQEALSLKQVLFIPCKYHAFAKHFQATDEQRLTMLHLALRQYPQFSIDERELHNEAPSYTIDLLRSLHNDYPQESLGFILGMELLLQLDRWHEWQALTHYATLIVLQRNDLTVQNANANLAGWLTQEADRIILLNNQPVMISSSAIRQKIAQDEKVKQWLPASVMQYIREHKLYAVN